MGPELKQKIAQQYPEWHRKPLRLTLNELMQPHQVFAEFFEMYNLPGIRACLRQWLEDALRAENVYAADHLYTCNHVERLVEAAWLMRQENGQKAKPYSREDDDHSVYEDEAFFGSSAQTIYRSLPFFDSVHLRSFCQVVLEAGTQESLRMEGPEDALQSLVARMHKQTLILENKPGARKEMMENITVYITYTELKLLATCSTGSIRTVSPVREAALHLVQNGTGNLLVQAETGSLQVVIHGAGNVQVSGSSFHTHIITYGPGHFDGSRWQTRAATVFLSGAGNIRLSVDKRLEGSVGGSGQLQYSGAPVLTALQLSEGAAVVQLDDGRG